MAPITILSPHPDDAVLSLWRTLSGPGEVDVINVFAAVPDDGQPPGWWDRLTGSDDPVARALERLEEDRDALSRSGRVPRNLNFLDGQYRDAPHPLDPLVEAVTAVLHRGARVLVPAALGAHPDHATIRDVGVALGHLGFEVAFYADLPHAVTRDWPESAVRTSTSGAETRVDDLDETERREKLAAVECYRTQVPELERVFAVLSRPEVLRYEIVWPYAGTAPKRSAVTASSASRSAATRSSP